MKNIHPLPVLANQTKKNFYAKVNPCYQVVNLSVCQWRVPPLQAKNNLKNLLKLNAKIDFDPETSGAT